MSFNSSRSRSSDIESSPTRSWGKDDPTLVKPGDRMGEGDTYLVTDILPDDLAEVAFENLKQEVAWNTMYHRGGEVPRLVAVEGEIGPDGSYPIYRHPADSSPPLLPFSPTVSLIRQHVEKALQHPVNHVLIQHYRSGADYISEHSDKTIDIVRGSKIVNVSLGAQRGMTLRTKKDALPRRVQRVPLPHNSMFVLGLDTNMRWTHSVRRDMRPVRTKSALEQSHGGERISLTFRHIGTYMTDGDDTRIFGQGAVGKMKEGARPVVHGGEEAARLVDAFGRENHQSTFDWNVVYGQGFDVLHLSLS